MSEIDDFLAYLIGDRAYSVRTIQTYEGALRDFENFFSSLDKGLTWKSVDADVVRQWMALQVEAGCVGRTMSKKLSALRSLFKYLLRCGVVDKDPMGLVRNPKLSKPLPVFIKECEMNRLFDEIEFPDDYFGHRDKTILLTFYNTGIRVSELLGLKVKDVDLVRNELVVLGKRNKQRIVPFGNELADSLRDYINIRSGINPRSEALFLNAPNRCVTYAIVRKVVNDYLGMVTTQQKRSPHVLRHTFATVMLNHGADLESIKELLGHESISTTEVYTHTTFAELKKEYEQAHPRA